MSWQLKGTPNPLIYSDEPTLAGRSVAISNDGKTAVAAGPDISNGNGRFTVYSYDSTTSTWRTTDPAGVSSISGFATSIAISHDGSIIAAGSPNDNNGVVFLYLYEGEKNVTQIGQIARPTGETCLGFGSFVSLRKNSNLCYVAVGAPSSATTANWGSVYTFTYNIDTSTLIQRMPVLHGSPLGSPLPDNFGSSVAMSSDFSRLIVGSPTNSKGGAYIFSWNSTTSMWNEYPDETFIGDTIDDNFGASVSMSDNGTKVVVGSLGSNDTGFGYGYVNAYNYNGALWIQYPLSNKTGINAGNQLGRRVSMNAGGSMFVAGIKTGSGSTEYVRVFTFNSSAGTWSSVDILNPNTTNGFGNSVALAPPGGENTLVIGAPGSPNGRSYVYYYTSSPPLCLTEGTRVLTSIGYRPVEQLEKFDHVTTADGRNVMIKHIHHSQHYNVGELEAPFHVPAHAIAENVPLHDVKLSPDHLIHIGDDLWLTPRGMAKRSDNVVQYDIGKNIHYYAIMTPNYFQDNLVIEDGVVVEAYGARDIVYDEEKKAYFRKAKEDK